MDHKAGVSLLLVLLLGLCNAQPEDVKNHTYRTLHNTEFIYMHFFKDLSKIESKPNKSANCFNICIVFHRIIMLVSGSTTVSLQTKPIRYHTFVFVVLILRTDLWDFIFSSIQERTQWVNLRRRTFPQSSSE